MHDRSKPRAAHNVAASSRSTAQQGGQTTQTAPFPTGGFGMSSTAGIMQLQRSIGNQAVGRMMMDKRIQRNTSGSPPVPTKLPASLPNSKAASMKSIMGAHLRDYDKQTDAATNSETFTVQEDKMIGSKISFRGEFETYDVTDSTGKWKLAKFDGKHGFIRSNKIGEIKGLSGARDKLQQITAQQAPNTRMDQIGAPAEEETASIEDRIEMIGEGSDIINTGPGGVSESLDIRIDDIDGVEGKEELKEELELQNAKLGMATAPGDMLMSGLNGLVAMKKIVDTVNDTEKSATEKGFDITEGVLDTGKSLQKGVESTSGFADNIGKLSDTSVTGAEAVSDWSGSVGEAISAIKSSFMIVKNVYDLFSKATSSEGISADEALSGGLEVVSNGLKVAQSAVKTVKSILDILKVGGAGLAQAIPGLGIAISGITITIKVYGMIKSAIATYRMTQAKRKFKEDYASKDYVGAKQYTLFGRNLWSSFNPGTDTAKLQQRKQDLIAKGAAASDAEQVELRDIQEYEVAKEMKYINQKRLTRAGIQIGLEMTNIAGDIATLSGAGAQVGVPLKAVAAGVGVTMSLGRKAKQIGRDRAAKPDAWKLTKMVFNAEKSSTVKHAKRVEQSNLILDMIAKLPEYKPSDPDIKKQYKRVENFIASSGVNPMELYRLNGDVGKQRELLIKSMKKRE
ncbi:hypothetical protein [Paenibacillus radicis (ex Xue et al. 2023)]|uniref:Pre-toxin TG domain-containing protein n=1 Tax=Paenibacillus radicis (ex Xue et al. 2023) TaxID=2972489 RepID=A0ABT1YNT3_9BACL|nr:hypothetical protein [Paenibacillus radicis (ex Xue et al. 2023)]MCR8634370.1 hypothetical protein [Paenibacillus radicis (ex Xue et al. 2023)]